MTEDTAVALDPPDDLLALINHVGGIADGDLRAWLDMPRPLPPSTVPAGLPVPGAEDETSPLYALDLVPSVSAFGDVPLSPPAETPGAGAGPAVPREPPARLFDALQAAPDPSIDYLSRFGVGPSSSGALAVDLKAQIRRMVRGL